MRLDPDLIKQAIANLIANAVRHGVGGVIQIGVERDEESVILFVENEGELIPDAVISTFGVPFVRSNEDAMRVSQKGLGLGLYVCSEIAKLHGGFLHVERDRTSGARIGLALPLERVVARDHPIEEALETMPDEAS